MKVGEKYVIRIDQIIYTPDGDPMALVYGVDHYTNPIALLTRDQLDYLEPLTQYNNLYYKEGYEKGYEDAENHQTSKYKLIAPLGSIVKSEIKDSYGDQTPVVGFYNGYYNGNHYIVSMLESVGSCNEQAPQGLAIRENEHITVLEKARETGNAKPTNKELNNILGLNNPDSVINQYIKDKKEKGEIFNGGTQVVYDETGSAIGLVQDSNTEVSKEDDEEAEKKQTQKANKVWYN